MTRFLRNLMLAAGLGLITQSAHAQYNANDLVLGLTETRALNDYVIDLGNANTAVGVGGTSLIDLSGLFSSSTFNSTFPGGLSSGVNMGVLGGNSATAGRDLYITVLRSSSGTPSVPGSTAPAPLASSPMGSGVADVASLVQGLSLSPGGSTTVAQAAANSWSSLISPGANPPSFTIDSGRDPMAQASSSVIYEDLYRGTPNAAPTYVGYFTLDTSSGDSLTFTPSLLAVPEPSSYSLLACGGLLTLWLRRRFSRNLA